MEIILKSIVISLYIIAMITWGSNYINAKNIKSKETLLNNYKRTIICVELLLVVEIINLAIV